MTKFVTIIVFHIRRICQERTVAGREIVASRMRSSLSLSPLDQFTAINEQLPTQLSQLLPDTLRMSEVVFLLKKLRTICAPTERETGSVWIELDSYPILTLISRHSFSLSLHLSVSFPSSFSLLDIIFPSGNVYRLAFSWTLDRFDGRRRTDTIHWTRCRRRETGGRRILRADIFVCIPDKRTSREWMRSSRASRSMSNANNCGMMDQNGYGGFPSGEIHARRIGRRGPTRNACTTWKI